jgi:hypothetical protein
VLLTAWIDMYDQREERKKQNYTQACDYIIISRRFNAVNGLCVAYTHSSYYMRSSAVIPSNSSVFFKVIPKALTSPRRAILTSLSFSLSTGTFS